MPKLLRLGRNMLCFSPTGNSGWQNNVIRQWGGGFGNHTAKQKVESKYLCGETNVNLAFSVLNIWPHYCIFFACTVKIYSTFICNETFIICEAALYMYYEKCLHVI